MRHAGGYCGPCLEAEERTGCGAAALTVMVSSARTSVSRSSMGAAAASAHTGSDLLELLPDEVVFEWAAGKDMHGHLGMHNLTAQPLAFKLKTTSLDTYRVRPTTGIIDANGTIYVKIVKRAERSFEVAADCDRDRFLVQAVPVDWSGSLAAAGGRAPRGATEGTDEAAALATFRRMQQGALTTPVHLYVRVSVVRRARSNQPLRVLLGMGPRGPAHRQPG